MIQPGALAAIRAGRPGIHLVVVNPKVGAHGHVFEAVGVVFHSTFHGRIKTRHLNGEPGPELTFEECVALVRTYEE